MHMLISTLRQQDILARSHQYIEMSIMHACCPVLVIVSSMDNNQYITQYLHTSTANNNYSVIISSMDN